MDLSDPANSHITFADWGRNGMSCRHSVFAVHDIPPAVYLQSMPKGPGGCSCLADQSKCLFSQGDVCSGGLWDEAVDEPIAYPFIANGDPGFCYVPHFRVENPRLPAFHSGPVVPPPPCGCQVRPSVPASVNPQDCSIGCKFSSE